MPSNLPTSPSNAPSRDGQDERRRQSDALHEEVRAYATRKREQSAQRFQQLALAIARYQVKHIPGAARLHQGKPPEDFRSIQPVFVDTFRLTRVAAHPASEDCAVFQTSGTTSGQTGYHPTRTLDTYDLLALELGRATLFSQISRGVVVALAEDPGSPPRSSLGHMMRLFIKEFDGRALLKDPQGAPFQGDEPGRFLVRNQMIDLSGLRRAIKIAQARGEPLVLLATAFSLLALVELLDGEVLSTPRRTRVMITGGFKGRKTDLDEASLRRAVTRALDLSPGSLIGEYGMTELTSQLYEADGFEPGLYFPPPWLQVDAVDPVTFEPLAEGEVGLARFIDLGNIDSALSLVVQDRITRKGSGIVLLGRSERAPLRGCSLPYEGLLPRCGNASRSGER